MSLFLNEILDAADRHRASDVFLIEGDWPRMKVDGELVALGDSALDPSRMRELWASTGTSPDSTTDLDTGLVSGSGTRFRVNLYRSMGRLGVVMRRIRTDLPVLADLGVPDELLMRWAQKTRGLILITGPTGMGKSTTMAGLLQWMNQSCARHIVTIEDPIEFIYPTQCCLFTQREVGRDTASYARGVRASMRQAPDVIMVGEIRDLETALVTLQASETGHLVLASIHSDSAVDAVDRLAHLFPPEQSGLGLHLLSQQLIGCLCQKLIITTGGQRMVVCEYLENGGAIRQWIARQDIDSIRTYMQRGNDPNCNTFLNHIVQCFEAGFIGETEAIAACGNEVEFRRAARGIS